MNLEQIKRQFIEVIEYSQNFSDPQIDELFDRWLEAKRDIIEAFDGKLIYEVSEEQVFSLNDVEKDRRIKEFLVSVEDCADGDLHTFIEENREGFFDNRVIVPCEYKNHKIPNGMKITKAIKYFEPSARRLNDYQTAISQYIQEVKIKGKLCFSVHPLDFLSISENSYNWHSCHALDGDYRAGNLSYMCDKATIVCYIKGAENAKLPLFPESVPWNSKKWRMLVYLNDNWDMIFAGRQYPFSSSNALEHIRNHLLPALKQTSYYYCEWTDPILEDVKDSYGHEYDCEDYMWVRGQIYPLKDIVIDYEGESSLHYNDIIRSPHYKRPHYIAKNNTPWGRYMGMTPVHVGSACKCLKCNDDYIINSNTFMCNDCECQYGTELNSEFGLCDCCGRRMFLDDAWIVDGDEICENCARNEAFCCERCGEAYYNTNREYIEETEEYVCRWCYEDYENCEKNEGE